LTNNKVNLILISILIGLISVAYYLAYYKYFRVDVDEGLIINGAMRVLSGQIPLKDFHVYMPGRYYFLAIWFLIFGKSVAVERLFFLLIHAVNNILIFHVSRKIVPLPFSLIPTVLLLLLPGQWIKADINCILLINIYLLWKYLSRPKRMNLIILGLAIGFAVYWREDMAGYSLMTVCLLILIAGIIRKAKFGTILQEGIVLAASVSAALIPMILLYATNRGLPRLAEGILETVRLGHAESLKLTSPLTFLKWPIRNSAGDFRLTFIYLTMLLFIGIGGRLVLRFKRNKPEERKYNLFMLAILILAGFSFTHIWQWTNEFRIPQTGSLIHVLWAFVIYQAFNKFLHLIKGPLWANRARGAAVFLFFLFAIGFQAKLVDYCATGHPHTQLDGGGIYLKEGPHREIRGTDRAGIYAPDEQAIPYSKILKYLARYTAPADSILCFGDNILYFLSGRKNATEFDKADIPAYFPKQRIKFLEQIVHNKPKVIVIRDFEYGYWHDFMPNVLDEISSRYFLDATIREYLIFRLVTDATNPSDKANLAIREGNKLRWNGDISGAVREYLKALKWKKGHIDLQNILNRFFFSSDYTDQSVPVLDGYAIEKRSRTWAVRWGSPGGRKFSGSIYFEKEKNLDQIISQVSAYPANTKAVTIAVHPNVIRFESDLRGGCAGLDLVFLESPRDISVVFALKIDRTIIKEVFVNDQGLISSSGLFILKKPRE
jgi:hypothetical protein